MPAKAVPVGGAAVDLVGAVLQDDEVSVRVREVSGQMQYIPNGSSFGIGSIAIALSAIPVLLAIRYFKKRIAEKG